MDNTVGQLNADEWSSLVGYVQVDDWVGGYIFDKFPLSPDDWHMKEIECYCTPEEKNAVSAWHFECNLTSTEITWILLERHGDHWDWGRSIGSTILLEPKLTLTSMARFLVDIISKCIHKNGSDKEYCIYSLPLKPLEDDSDKEKVWPICTLFKAGFYVDVSMKMLRWNAHLVTRSLIGLKIFEPSLEKRD